ncbi:uncharacterized protein BDZ99DRAFT_567455 [Mytilinidion resinicola]|uniref:Uncharacterized protein n=1 Tax=Mytilinidion resinicola TaxID=574789 RepID=A0A6A6YZ34_9PEZI|nr:uncharacterized protein BDZ99DRAFT_567455 [Mytilinidion resinicola]KAF2813703.1 hypothetical protein BDZ99DRAFT_567455 [Mytilinidion resinicola]
MDAVVSRDGSAVVLTSESVKMKANSAASIRLLDLTNEILLEITSLLPDRHFRCSLFEGAAKQSFELADLRNARLVCKAVAAIGDLWLTTNLTRLYLDASPKSLRTFEAVCGHPLYSKAIREIVYIGSRIADNLRDWKEYYKQAVDWYMYESIRAGEFYEVETWPYDHDKTLERFSPSLTPEVVQAMERMHKVYIQRLDRQESELHSKADLIGLTKAFENMPNVTSLGFITSTETGAVGWNMPEIWHDNDGTIVGYDTTIFQPHKMRRIWSCESFGECDECDKADMFAEGSFLYQRESWQGFDTLMEALLDSKNTISQLKLGDNETRIPVDFLRPYPAQVHVNTGRVFANLKQIYISFSMEYQGFAARTLFSPNAHPLVTVLSHCHNLELLELIDDQRDFVLFPDGGDSDTVGLILTIHFPRLKKLFLKETVATPRALLAFCEAHRSTLKALGLDDVCLFRSGYDSDGRRRRFINNTWRPFLTKIPSILALEEGLVKIGRRREYRDLYEWEKELGKDCRGASPTRCSKDDCCIRAFNRGSEYDSDMGSDVDSGTFDFSDQIMTRNRS